jgi:peptidoglycan hydrolase-like protein with peptidoglycan-binding domain
VSRPLRTTLIVGSAVVVAGVVTAAAIGFGGSAPTPASSNTGLPPATAPVTRTTLTQTQMVNGTLGYGTPVTVTAHGEGTITWLPPLGATISRGRPVYKANNLAVPLFYGVLPLYRPLRSGDIGDDVKEVERNLAALGYTGLTVDKRYTAATASAVKRWQKALGLAQTGVFDPASVVMAPAAVRVALLAAHLGDPASGPVLAYAGTTRIVSVALDVALQNLVRANMPAVVTLPDGKTVDGTLATVGTVAIAATAAQQQGDSQGPPEPATIEVTVAVSDQSKLGRLDQAPVTVSLVSETAENVLTVPVAALVALAEGGYGVEVVTGSASRYVAVQLGMFANGKVEVTGDGIVEGTVVGVPA